MKNDVDHPVMPYKPFWIRRREFLQSAAAGAGLAVAGITAVPAER